MEPTIIACFCEDLVFFGMLASTTGNYVHALPLNGSKEVPLYFFQHSNSPYFSYNADAKRRFLSGEDYSVGNFFQAAMDREHVKFRNGTNMPVEDLLLPIFENILEECQRKMDQLHRGAQFTVFPNLKVVFPDTTTDDCRRRILKIATKAGLKVQSSPSLSEVLAQFALQEIVDTQSPRTTLCISPDSGGLVLILRQLVHGTNTLLGTKRIARAGMDLLVEALAETMVRAAIIQHHAPIGRHPDKIASEIQFHHRLAAEYLDKMNNAEQLDLQIDLRDMSGGVTAIQKADFIARIRQAMDRIPPIVTAFLQDHGTNPRSLHQVVLFGELFAQKTFQQAFNKQFSPEQLKVMSGDGKYEVLHLSENDAQSIENLFKDAGAELDLHSLHENSLVRLYTLAKGGEREKWHQTLKILGQNRVEVVHGNAGLLPRDHMLVKTGNLKLGTKLKMVLISCGYCAGYCKCRNLEEWPATFQTTEVTKILVAHPFQVSSSETTSV